MVAARLKILCGILVVLLAGALALIFHDRNVIQRLEERPPAPPGFETLVERAYRLEAARGGMPVAEMKQHIYPVVVSFPDRNCVQLTTARSPSIGGHSLYCFRNTDGALVERYQVGE